MLGGTLVGMYPGTYSSLAADEDGLDTTEGTETADTGTTDDHDSHGSGVGKYEGPKFDELPYSELRPYEDGRLGAPDPPSSYTAPPAA